MRSRHLRPGFVARVSKNVKQRDFGNFLFSEVTTAPSIINLMISMGLMQPIPNALYEGQEAMHGMLLSIIMLCVCSALHNCSVCSLGAFAFGTPLCPYVKSEKTLEEVRGLVFQGVFDTYTHRMR